MQLQDIQTGELILLDVSAAQATKESAALEPMKIISTSAGTAKQESSVQTTATPVPVALTRYAAQNLYARLWVADFMQGRGQCSTHAVPGQQTEIAHTAQGNLVQRALPPLLEHAAAMREPKVVHRLKGVLLG
ncbi:MULTISPECIES: DUF3438 family protein [unclassified Pseudomonas]|uniref:DUF3438 family protein n=1 Tax=unclassified Pseudomonas TaxID=196821 RepID=UPI0021152D69|nr:MULTISPECIES: DUF3438 family protein [unclassified Pseudomonas]